MNEKKHKNLIYDSIQFIADEEGTKQNTTHIPLQRINLFVGPNNSGKSLALREIGEYAERIVEKPYYTFSKNINNLKILSIKNLYPGYNEKIWELIKDKVKKDFEDNWLFKMFLDRINKDETVQTLEMMYLIGDENPIREFLNTNKLNKEKLVQLAIENLESSEPKNEIKLEKLKKYLSISKEESLSTEENELAKNIFDFELLKNCFYIFLENKKILKENFGRALWDEKFINPLGYITKEHIKNATLLQSKQDFQFTFSSNVPRKMLDQFEECRLTIEKNFGYKVSIDFNGGVNYRICGDDDYKKYMLLLTEDSETYFSNQTLLSECGDGIQSLIHTVFKIYSSKAPVFLLDEPEVFLHPPYARKLGSIFYDHSLKHDSQFFIATHNQNLLQGILESGTDVNVFRLTYKNKNPKVHLLDSEQLKIIIKDARFRFSGLLESIFSDGVILVEGDSDRRIYYQALELYLNIHPEERIDGLNFVVANGKANVPIIAEKLYKLGIPFATIIDADAIENGNIQLIFNKINSPDKKNIITNIESFQNALDKEEDYNGKNKAELLKRNGFNSFKSETTRKTFESFNETLKRNQVYIVPKGTLECLLPELWKEIEKEASTKEPDEKLTKKDLEQTNKNKWEEKALEFLISAEQNTELPDVPLISFIREVNNGLRKILGGRV